MNIADKTPNFLLECERLMEQDDLSSIPEDNLKFWYSSSGNKFVDHDIDTHHIRIAAGEPGRLGLSPEEVAHHPHASGNYTPDDDEDDDFDGEEWADNNDMGIFANLFSKGWVRGGHEIDLMSYFERGRVDHQGGIYLQSSNLRAVRKCVAACLKRWPSIETFRLAVGNVNATISGDDVDRFIKYGTLPKSGTISEGYPK